MIMRLDFVVPIESTLVSSVKALDKRNIVLESGVLDKKIIDLGN